MAIAEVVERRQHNLQLVAGVLLELAPAALILGLALKYDGSYDKYAHPEYGNNVFLLLLFGPAGLGWLLMRRFHIGMIWFVGRILLMFLPALLFLMNSSEAERDCGLSNRRDPIGRESCVEEAERIRLFAYGSAAVLALASAATLTLLEFERGESGESPGRP